MERPPVRDLQPMDEPRPDVKARLDALWNDFEAHAARLTGYPCNLDFDYSALLPIMRYAANNVGDPFHESNFKSNTHEIEREVIAQFADFMRLDPKEMWGYVTTGGTEGNMYGLYMAREIFPDGVVYFSQDTHYSVLKILRVLNMRQVMIRSQDNGEIEYEDLYETIRVYRDAPVIFMANIGATMKGAVDDLDKVRGHPPRPGDYQVLHPRRRRPERHDLAVRRRPAALRLRCRRRQRLDQRTQAHRLPDTLRRRADQAELRGPHRARCRIRGRPRHHPAGVA